MKTQRISRIMDSDSKRARNKNGKLVQYSGPSFSDLPMDIMRHIFFMLSVKSILVCKSVCKTWRDDILHPKFAHLHFDEHCDEVYPLIHASDTKSPSEMLCLSQPDKDDFEQKLAMCDHTYSNPGCICKVKVALDTKFVLPPHNNDYLAVNSCNGFLCLSHRSDRRSVMICNPITGEYINLPRSNKVNLPSDVSYAYAFGFSLVANQYKVVRMIVSFNRSFGKVTWSDQVTVTVHTVGSESWRDIESKPQHYMYGLPTYLNGFLYWSGGPKPLSLISFDVENESFSLELGPELDPHYKYATINMGVLGGELCVICFTEFGNFVIWALKGSGVDKMWTEVFSIDMFSCGRQIFYDSVIPIKYLNDGSLLMCYSYGNALVHVDRKKCRFRFLKIHGTGSEVKTVVAHTPSLVSLKHSLSKHNANALNFQSRCEESKLHKPAGDLYIVEEEFPPYSTEL